MLDEPSSLKHRLTMWVAAISIAQRIGLFRQVECSTTGGLVEQIECSAVMVRHYFRRTIGEMFPLLIDPLEQRLSIG